MNLKFYTQTRRDNPEARLQKTILQHLKIAGVPDLIYFHPANEGRRSVVTGAHLKALGMLPGVADLVIIRDGKAHFMEVKAEKGRLSDAQKEFAVLAVKAGAEWAVVHSIAEAITVLRDWQVIRKLAA
jgi:hypothetical protein